MPEIITFPSAAINKPTQRNHIKQITKLKQTIRLKQITNQHNAHRTINQTTLLLGSCNQSNKSHRTINPNRLNFK